MGVSETSDETISDPTKLPVNRCDIVKEKHTQRQQERGASQKEKPALASVRTDEASYYTRVVGKPVLTAVSGVTRHLAKRLPTESSQKGGGDLRDWRLNTAREVCGTDSGEKG